MSSSTPKKAPKANMDDVHAALQALITQAKKDGMIRASDLNAQLEKMQLTPEKIEDIYDRLDAMNIQVVTADLELDLGDDDLDLGPDDDINLAGIDEEVLLITPNVIKPIQKLKVEYLGSRNPRLHMEEVLIALSSSTESNPLADLALRQLPNLRGSQVHTSRMLNAADEKTFQKLGIMLTSEAK